LALNYVAFRIKRLKVVGNRDLVTHACDWLVSKKQFIMPF